MEIFLQIRNITIKNSTLLEGKYSLEESTDPRKIAIRAHLRP